MSVAAGGLLLPGVATAQSAAPNADHLAKLEDAEHAWNSARLENYQYKLIYGGDFGYHEHKVKFTYSRCSARTRFVSAKTGAWEQGSCEYITMSALFSQIRRSLQAGTERVELEVDADTGHIIHFSVQFDDSVAPDQDWYLKVSDFKVN